MPIYEFVCQDCGHEFEKIQSFSDTSLPVCPHCAGEQVARQVSRPAIHFKGSGWYITDSKEKGKKPSKEAANGVGATDSSSSDAAAGDSTANGDANKAESGSAAAKEETKPTEKSSAKSSKDSAGSAAATGKAE